MCGKAVPLHRVFHGIRFKVSKRLVVAMTTFFFFTPMRRSSAAWMDVWGRREDCRADVRHFLYVFYAAACEPSCGRVRGFMRPPTGLHAAAWIFSCGRVRKHSYPSKLSYASAERHASAFPFVLPPLECIILPLGMHYSAPWDVSFCLVGMHYSVHTTSGPSGHWQQVCRPLRMANRRGPSVCVVGMWDADCRLRAGGRGRGRGCSRAPVGR